MKHYKKKKDHCPDLHQLQGPHLYTQTRMWAKYSCTKSGIHKKLSVCLQWVCEMQHIPLEYFEVNLSVGFISVKE